MHATTYMADQLWNSESDLSYRGHSSVPDWPAPAGRCCVASLHGPAAESTSPPLAPPAGRWTSAWQRDTQVNHATPRPLHPYIKYPDKTNSTY